MGSAISPAIKEKGPIVWQIDGEWIFVTFFPLFDRASEQLKSPFDGDRRKVRAEKSRALSGFGNDGSKARCTRYRAGGR
jgi:hypothetical protein